ncbi:hypothetical protein ZTR_07290 [Talaromyces verruculosus]|nr:hypothetical protein ZTR_07290 [Talaromyces verruculosus]
METPPRASSDSSESGEVSLPLRAVDIENTFLDGASPRAHDIDMDFKVVFHDEIYAYKVTIKLYDYGTDDVVPWAAPIPKVSVTYWTESGERPSEEPIQLQFVPNQEGYAAFFERTLDFPWDNFLVIGIQFDQQTVNYYHITPQGQGEARSVAETRRNHPQLKEKVGGSYDQLKQMGDSYRPQAKEEVDKTWQKISDIIKVGVSVELAEKLRVLTYDKLQSLGLEESQGYLEKNPKLKQLIEENADILKEGNFKELRGLLKDKVLSGKTEDVEKYVKG